MYKLLRFSKAMIIALMITFLLTLFTSIFTANAAPLDDADSVDETNLVRVETVNVAPSTTGTLDIEIENADKMIAAEITIQYDQTKGLILNEDIIQGDRIKDFDIVASHNDDNLAQASLKLAFFSIFNANLALQPGNGPIFTIPYTVTESASGTIPVSVTGVTLLDKDADGNDVDLDATSENGAVNIQSVQGTIDAVTPDKGNQGQTIDVVITGGNVDWVNNKPNANFGDGITVNSVTAVSATQVKVNVTIGSGASTGTRAVTLEGSGDTLSKPTGFTVEESPKGATIYVVDTPYTLNVGETHELTVMIDPGPTPVNGTHIRGKVDTKYAELINVVGDTAKLNKIIKGVKYDKTTGEFSYTAGVLNKTISEPFPILSIYLKGKSSTPEEGTKIEFANEFPPTDVSGPEGSVLQAAEDGILHITSDAILVGKVTLQGRSTTAAQINKVVPLTIEFRESGEITPSYTYVVTTTTSAKFTMLEGVPAGTYDIAIKGNHTLRILKKDVKLDVGINDEIAFGTLPEGDINRDNRVLIDDFGFMSPAYNTQEGSENYYRNADLIDDGDVDAADFSLYSANLEKRGETVIAASRQPTLISQEEPESMGSAIVKTTIAPIKVDVDSEITATHTITFFVNPKDSLVSAVTLHYGYDPARIEVLDFQLMDAPLDFVLEDPTIDAENGIVRASAGLFGETVDEPFAIATMKVKMLQGNTCVFLESLDIFPETQVAGPEGNVLDYAENVAQRCLFLPIVAVGG